MREEGYYWVKRMNKWNIAMWYNGYWILSGHGLKYSDYDFQEINENRLVYERR